MKNTVGFLHGYNKKLLDFTEFLSKSTRSKSHFRFRVHVFVKRSRGLTCYIL